MLLNMTKTPGGGDGRAGMFLENSLFLKKKGKGGPYKTRKGQPGLTRWRFCTPTMEEVIYMYISILANRGAGWKKV